MRTRSTWGETVALILRDCEPEARIEFMTQLASWKRISEGTIRAHGDEPEHGDRVAAETRLVKLQALEEHLQRELAFARDLDAMASRLFRTRFGC